MATIFTGRLIAGYYVPLVAEFLRSTRRLRKCFFVNSEQLDDPSSLHRVAVARLIWCASADFTAFAHTLISPQTASAGFLTDRWGWGRSHWRFRKIVRNRTFARSWSVYNCVRATADVDHRYAPFSGLEGSWGNWSPTSFHPYAPCLPRKIYHASFAIAHAQYTSYDVPRLFDDDIISIKKDYHDNCIGAVCVVCMRERAHNDSICNLKLRITKIEVGIDGWLYFASLWQLQICAFPVTKRTLIQTSLSAQESHGHDVLFPTLSDDEPDLYTQAGRMCNFEMLSDKKKRVILEHAELDDGRTVVDKYENPRRVRLAHVMYLTCVYVRVHRSVDRSTCVAFGALYGCPSFLSGEFGDNLFSVR